jgi:hypothetical protein
MASGPDVSFQCENKFIASFTVGLGNGLGWGYTMEKYMLFSVLTVEPELEAELKGGGDRLLVTELGSGVNR